MLYKIAANGASWVKILRLVGSWFEAETDYKKRIYGVLKQAANEVTAQKCSVREATKTFRIAKTSLQRYINKYASQPATLRVGYQGIAQAHTVFTNAKEQEIANHIKAFDDRFYGLCKI
ncbi:hypothetical protein EB796_011410 [Bugula neritina]|uniref:HTH psq-type domain-containing protein n=1 Tax=Bugula neritina TaxID=10212 RepID=A0A7J7JV78_BUGNE|nr:hypothetical protein EB796_011410 [Bugula neritina]